jgi:hypothetical protein
MDFRVVHLCPCKLDVSRKRHDRKRPCEACEKLPRQWARIPVGWMANLRAPIFMLNARSRSRLCGIPSVWFYAGSYLWVSCVVDELSRSLGFDGVLPGQFKPRYRVFGIGGRLLKF